MPRREKYVPKHRNAPAEPALKKGLRKTVVFSGVAVAATGAYCYAMASNYNRIPRPPVVAVSDSAAQLIVRRESLDEVMATDVGWSAGAGGVT